MENTQVKDIIKSLLTEDGDLIIRDILNRFPELSKYEEKEVRNVMYIALFKDMKSSELHNLIPLNDWVCDMSNNTQYTVTRAYDKMREFVMEKINKDNGSNLTMDQMTDELSLQGFKHFMASILGIDESLLTNITIEETILGKMFLATQNGLAPIVEKLINNRTHEK